MENQYPISKRMFGIFGFHCYLPSTQKCTVCRNYFAPPCWVIQITPRQVYFSLKKSKRFSHVSRWIAEKVMSLKFWDFFYLSPIPCLCFSHCLKLKIRSLHSLVYQETLRGLMQSNHPAIYSSIKEIPPFTTYHLLLWFRWIPRKVS